MFGSSLDDLELRRVWNHRTYRSFADEFNIPQEYAVLVFDVRRAAVSLPLQVYRLKVLVEAGLVAFSSACFEFADEVLEEAQHGSLAHLSNIFPAIFMAFRRLLLWGSARRCLLASSLCCHAAFISAFTPGPAHQPRAPRRRLERSINSAAVAGMTSAISVAMSLIQVPSGIGGSVATSAFTPWPRRFESVIDRLRSVSFVVSLVLSLFLQFVEDLRGMRPFAYTIL